MEKTYSCKVDSRWMWGLENANVTITSPTGGYVRIDKWHMDKLTSEQADLVWKCVQAYDMQGSGIQLTRKELVMLSEIAKIAGSMYSKTKAPAKPKPSSSYVRISPMSDRCGCGGTLIIKDHGSWIGYFCPKCKGGGSRSSKKKHARR